MAKKNKNKNKPDGTEEDSLVVGPFDPNQIGPTNGIYDPNNSYGLLPSNPNVGTFEEWLANQGLNPKKLNKQRKARLKDQWTQAAGPAEQEYGNTPEGKQRSNEDPDTYWNYLMAEAGALAPSMGGSQFAQYLANDYRSEVMKGYDAAKIASHGGISFADYTKSIGWGPGQQVGTLQGAAPRDTGNPYTSTSMPQAGGTGVQINQSTPPFSGVRDFAQQQGLDWGDLNKQRQNRIQDNFNAYNNTTMSLLNRAASAGTTPILPDIPGADGLADARKRYLSLLPQQRGINTGTSFRPGRWAVYG